MRNLLALFAAAVLAFAGVGWYLDWYHVRNEPAAVPGHNNVSIDINRDKILQDVHKGVQKGEEKLEGALQKGADAASGQDRPTVSIPAGTGKYFPGN